jgi:hypothetical protein
LPVLPCLQIAGFNPSTEVDVDHVNAQRSRGAREAGSTAPSIEVETISGIRRHFREDWNGVHDLAVEL